MKLRPDQQGILKPIYGYEAYQTSSRWVFVFKRLKRLPTEVKDRLLYGPNQHKMMNTHLGLTDRRVS